MTKDVNKKQTRDLNTEERILQVAAELFTKKGYTATKTRDIAEAAGINIASLHYYYRTKDKLFEIVATRALKQFRGIMQDLFAREMPLHQKIYAYVEKYTNFLRANPYLPLFIVTESEKNPEKLGEITRYREEHAYMEQQLYDLADRGIIRPISLSNFIQNLVGLTVFPFLSKSMMMLEMEELTEADYEHMLEERKQLVPEILIRHLYLQPPGEE